MGINGLDIEQLLIKTGVLENLASQTSHAETIGQDGSILPWILSRIQKKEAVVSQNKQYAAEILAILLQSSPKNRSKFIEVDGIDVLLQLLSAYRKRDPVKDSDEEEYVENLFDSLICLVEEDAGKEKFVENEGIELALIMLREGKFSKSRSLRVLDHALGGVGGAPACERLVEAAGLKTIFGMFMKKVNTSMPVALVETNIHSARGTKYRAFLGNLCFPSASPAWWLCATYPDTSKIHGKGLRKD